MILVVCRCVGAGVYSRCVGREAPGSMSAENRNICADGKTSSERRNDSHTKTWCLEHRELYHRIRNMKGRHEGDWC